MQEIDGENPFSLSQHELSNIDKTVEKYRLLLRAEIDHVGINKEETKRKFWKAFRVKQEREERKRLNP